jgi:hypothetical protein
VLGLTDQILSDNLRISAFIRDHQDLRGAGKHVDANLPKQQALCLGDELIAWPYQNIGRSRSKMAICHGRNPLNTAHGQHDIRPAQLQSIQNGGMNPLLAPRRRAGGNMLNACRPRGGHTHDR